MDKSQEISPQSPSVRTCSPALFCPRQAEGTETATANPVESQVSGKESGPVPGRPEYSLRAGTDWVSSETRPSATVEV